MSDLTRITVVFAMIGLSAGVLLLVSPDAHRPNWETWGSWKQAEEGILDGRIPCTELSRATERTTLHRRGSDIMNVSCFDRYDFETKDGARYRYVAVIVRHSLNREFGEVHYVLDLDQGTIVRSKPAWTTWGTDLPLDWRPGTPSSSEYISG